MARIARALLVAVMLMAVLGAPIIYLLPADPVIQAPFVPLIVVVAGGVSYVYVYRGGPETRHTVTGPDSGE
jgi:hypothetical protein